MDRTRDFDRRFRPTSRRTRKRWERMATAARRGESFPPIDVYRIGEVHFVKDGHHRVSIARAQGLPDIDAYVTEVQTELGADRTITLRDLPLKSHERLFFERVPLPAEARERIKLGDEEQFAMLAEQVEAWGFRLIQELREPLDRDEVARRWFDDEYVPVVELLREADLIGKRTETEAYMKVAGLRYMLLRTHEWDEQVIERLREELRLARAQRAAVVRVEQLDVRHVDPELDLLALACASDSAERRAVTWPASPDGRSAAPGVLRRAPRAPSTATPLVPLDVEVHVQLGAHRLEHVDLRLERGAAVATPSSTCVASSKCSGRMPAITSPFASAARRAGRPRPSAA